MPYRPEKKEILTIDASNKESLFNGLKKLEEQELWIKWIDLFIEGLGAGTLDKSNPDVKNNFLYVLDVFKNEGMWQSWSDSVSRGISLGIINSSEENIKNSLIKGVDELKRKGFDKARLRLITKGVELKIIGKDEFPEYKSYGINS